jgi:hypothetical protein
MLSIAFKEWAVVCEALARGVQTVILRKGGIAETGGVFTPEHSQFWLYPTFFHEQQQAGVKPEWLHLLQEVEATKPETGLLRFTQWVEVEHIEYLTDLEKALAQEPHHILNEAVIRQRFAYRTPGLYFLNVRVHRAAEPLVLVERPEYAGCKTWVELIAES